MNGDVAECQPQLPLGPDTLCNKVVTQKHVVGLE